MTGAYAWYLAGVQAKVWAVWASQVHPDFAAPVQIQFTILEDGTLADIGVLTSSGNTVLDLAAWRAIESAGPFAPLPRDMETRPLTIRAHFTPRP